jgi:hypothetical protein
MRVSEFNSGRRWDRPLAQPLHERQSITDRCDSVFQSNPFGFTVSNRSPTQAAT